MNYKQIRTDRATKSDKNRYKENKREEKLTTKRQVDKAR